MELFAGSSYVVRSSFQRGIRWSPRFLAIAALIVLASASLAFGQAGTLDSTYGTGGIATVFSPANGNLLTAAAIQSDDKIVLGGSAPGDVLVRLNTNGSLDTSFGTNGVVSQNFGVLGPILAVVIQPNQQILALASGFGGAALGRFNADGSLDTTFGTGGFATSRALDSGPETLSVMALQPNGAILITGNGLLGRFTSSGQLDATFGTLGVAPMTNTIATSIAVQADGKILVTSGIAPAPELFGAPPLPSPFSGSISRYTSTGSLDTNFGIAGIVACPASAAGIALQPNGKSVVVGTLTSGLVLGTNGTFAVPNNQLGFAAVRYNTNGSIDTTFNPGLGIGSGGGVVTGFGSSFQFGSPFGAAIQSNGDIVLGGEAGNGNTQGFQLGSSSFALTRYTPSGQLDTSFGNNGIVITRLSSNLSFINVVLLQSDGKIVAVGNSGSAGESSFVASFVAARYLAQ
jgi:uncharacterized delta-60 repeat protein